MTAALILAAPTAAALGGFDAFDSDNVSQSDFGAGPDDYSTFGIGGDDRLAFGADGVSGAEADAIIKQHLAKQRITDARKAKMDPNRGSDVGVYDYVFSFSKQVTVGTALASTVITKQPSQPFHPETLCINAPSVGFGYLTQGSIGNSDWMLGDGDCDMYLWSPVRVDRKLNLPPMSSSTTAKATLYTTTTGPSPFNSGQSFTLTIQFEGPALQR